MWNSARFRNSIDPVKQSTLGIVAETTVSVFAHIRAGGKNENNHLG